VLAIVCSAHNETACVAGNSGMKTMTYGMDTKPSGNTLVTYRPKSMGIYMIYANYQY
jgi:hypothetical protein